MSRSVVNEALANNTQLLALGMLADATFAANMIDTPTIRPFIVMRWEETTRAFARIGSQGLTIWVHDEVGDYTRIDAMLEIIKSVLTSIVHVAGGDGKTVTQIDWAGDSPDLYDDGFATISRNAGFIVVSRPT